MSASRLNALRAVEADPVRRRERLLDVRLYAAVALAGRLEQFLNALFEPIHLGS